MRKLMFHLECIEKEREIVKMGINTFIYRDDIEELFYFDGILLRNKRICKYHTSLKHCGFIINTSAVDIDSVNTLIEGLNKFNVNEVDNGPLYNPFVYSIAIKEPLNTACGNVIPSGVYPLYKYGAFEVGKFQQFDKYIREYDLPQITINVTVVKKSRHFLSF